MRSIAFVLWLVTSANALGQESHRLVFKSHAGPGGTCVVDKREIVKVQTKLIALKNKEALEDYKESKVFAFKYRETILELLTDEMEPVRRRRHYELAQLKDGGEFTSLPLHGRTVIIEKKDVKYRFHLDDGRDLTAKEAEPLVGEFQSVWPRFDLDELLTEPFVRVNETYKINPKVLVKVFAPLTGPKLIDEFQPRGEYKLERVYRKDERRYGVLDVRIDLPVQEVASFAKPRPGGERLAMHPGAMMRIRLSIDGCIDGSILDITTKTNLFLDGIALLPSRAAPAFHLLLKLETATETTMQEVRVD